jgi:8-oxo-dGTP diphosphatase
LEELPMRETYLSVYAPIARDGRVLLAYNQRGPYKGTWGLPGGGVEFGETPEQAIRRELWEEIGVHVETPTLYDVHSHRTLFERPPVGWIDFHHIALLYRVTLKTAPAEQIHSPDPSEQVAWHALDSLKALPLSPCAHYCLLSQEAIRATFEMPLEV